MRHYKPNDPFKRKGWSKKEILVLQKSYKTYPYSIPRSLLERHSASACYNKAARMRLNSRLRNPGLDLRKLTIADKAYIAGFIDGEGSFLKKRSTILIANTNKEVLTWIKDKFVAGHLAITRRKYRNPKYKDLYQLHIGGTRNVYDILRAIEPYLIVKRSLANEVLKNLMTKYGAKQLKRLYHNNLS